MLLSQLRANGKLQQGYLLLALGIACFSLSLVRVYYTESRTYLFLNWNLFLAFIPWALSSWLTIRPKLAKSWLALLPVLGAWLLFFPNAPYILTDLYHLKPRFGAPVWYDLILILSFAWTGLMFGFLSLIDLEEILARKLPKWGVILSTVALLFLSAFGIYLGRYLRWNSWDILTQPFGLFADIGDRFVNPREHPRTWGVTIFMGFFLNMLYWSFRLTRRN
ncbi:MAG: DUF1361 domain-containing protein [Bacteroidota bacterium]